MPLHAVHQHQRLKVAGCGRFVLTLCQRQPCRMFEKSGRFVRGGGHQFVECGLGNGVLSLRLCFVGNHGQTGCGKLATPRQAPHLLQEAASRRRV